MTAPRILIVEDERVVALHLRRQLLGLGYEVPDAVANGHQALHEVERTPPDLVLMDINLEGDLDGIATAARISPDRRIPVIYLTAYSEEGLLTRASATNTHGYLLKPFSERELHAMIQVTLARCRSERAADAAENCRRQAEKLTALGELAAGVAQDFDEMLSDIYGQLEVLGAQTAKHPELARPIEQAFGHAIEKEQLIRQLLAFSGRQKLAPRAVAMNYLISGVTKQLGPTLGAAIRIDTDLPDNLWTAHIDPNQFRQALINLALNARDAMPDGGRLTIEARNIELDQEQTTGGAVVTSGDYVLLTLADTGTGMAEHVVQRVFEPFFTTKPDGDGLGLSLVFGFVRQSGGHLSIDSKPGAGTTVRLWLPAIPDDAPVILAADTGEPADQRQPEPANGMASFQHRPAQAASGGSPAPVPIPVLWHKAENSVFASVPADDGGVRYRLVVEPLPKRNGWDWTVWSPDDQEREPRYGRATSLVAAMAAAEATARAWAEP